VGLFAKKVLHLPPLSGALAQLARVSDWQSEGHGFDSHTLHGNVYPPCSSNKADFFIIGQYILNKVRALSSIFKSNIGKIIKF
jgi:hypothetical protein